MGLGIISGCLRKRSSERISSSMNSGVGGRSSWFWARSFPLLAVGVGVGELSESEPDDSESEPCTMITRRGGNPVCCPILESTIRGFVESMVRGGGMDATVSNSAI